MRKISIVFLTLISMSGFKVQAYEPAGDRIMTKWGEDIDPSSVWEEYPRPIMERSEWQNLNGLWEYAITGKDATAPKDWQGEILVPFCAESSLSGVGRHTGGYTPFSLNITQALNPKGNNRIVVRVWDPTDKGYQPRGKQHSRPHQIWYTPVTGIWQTVWLEPVNRNHISNLKISPDIDNNTLTVKVQSEGDNKHYITEVSVKDNGRIIASGKALPRESATVKPTRSVALGFIIGDKEGKWAYAHSKQTDDRTIELASILIDKPSAVRYNWADYPDGNLYGENNLPVLPFACDIK